MPGNPLMYSVPVARTRYFILSEELESIEEEISIVSEFVPHSEKEFTVKCKVVENNKNIFEVSTFAASREQAKFISDNWKENAINIYPKIIDLLTNPNQEL